MFSAFGFQLSFFLESGCKDTTIFITAKFFLKFFGSFYILPLIASGLHFEKIFIFFKSELTTGVETGNTAVDFSKFGTGFDTFPVNNSACRL